MAEQQNSIFAAMNKNARLRKHMAKAKTVQAAREFDGPDGDYECTLKRFMSYEKDGNLNIIFEFRVIGGEYAEQKIIIFIKLADGPIRTAEEEQDLMFQTIQLMGVNTDQDEAAIERDLNAFIASGAAVTVRMKTSKPNKDKRTFKNPSVVGVATEGRKEISYVVPDEPSAEDWPEVDENDVPPDADEWGDEPAAEEVFLPSSLIGMPCVYKNRPCVLVNANDESGKCIVECPKTKKRMASIDFNDLVWPEA